MVDDRVVRVVLKNGAPRPARLVLRPFSATYDLARGESFEVRAHGPSTGTITVEQVEDGSIVTGWPGCILSVHTLKQLGGMRIEPTRTANAPTVALLRRMWALRGHPQLDDDDDTLV